MKILSVPSSFEETRLTRVGALLNIVHRWLSLRFSQKIPLYVVFVPFYVRFSYRSVMDRLYNILAVLFKIVRYVLISSCNSFFIIYYSGIYYNNYYLLPKSMYIRAIYRLFGCLWNFLFKLIFVWYIKYLKSKYKNRYLLKNKAINLIFQYW